MTEHRLISQGELHLTGPVGFVDFEDEGFTVRDVTGALSEMDGDITVRINSGGGFAFDGIAIHSLLRQHDGKVTTVVQGIAASAASVIFMAGDERVMSEGAILMIHDASGMTMGTEADHIQTAKGLGKLSNSLAGIYAGRTKRGNDVERAAMRDETWLDGADAVEAGFATEATDTGAAEASAFNYSIYMNAPDFLLKPGKSAVEKFDRVAAAVVATPRQPSQEETMTEAPKPVVAETKPATVITIDADAIKAEAATAEAKRIQDCMAQLRDDSSDKTKALAFVAGTTPGDIAMAVNAEVKAMGDKFLANLKAQDGDLTDAGLKAAPVAIKTETKPAPASTPDGWKAEFEASDNLKAEFMSADDYAAYMQADAAGRIHTLRGKDAA